MEYNGKYSVYTHKVVTDDNGPMWYVGVTRQNLKDRWKPALYKGKSLWPYIEKYGWHNIEHRVIFDGLDREMALKLEDFLIMMYRSADCGINKQPSGHIRIKDQKTYMTQYDKEHSDDKKQYYIDHRNEIAEKNKRYREEHKEELKVKEKTRRSTPEGKIYSRVRDFNRRHPDRAVETPMEAKRKFLEYGYVPDYIKRDDIITNN